MKIKEIGKIVSGQDGAVFNGYLFRFDEKGNCTVYQTDKISKDSLPVSRFVLDKADTILPHSNSVVFGNCRYDENDEFPLLYSNVYNNYANKDNKMKGVTCVYRLQKYGNEFSTTLVQIIEVGFTEDEIWASHSHNDVRPYGNFVIGTNSSLLYTFTMRDEEKKTRYFSFELPNVNAGVYDNIFGARRVTLKKEDIIDFFDCEYHRYIQGACCKNDIIYSLEGFSNDKNNPPAIRLIDIKLKKQKEIYCFSDFGLTVEPEFIDFDNENCYYADSHGNLYELIF